MVEDPKQPDKNKAQLETLQRDLDEERKRSEEYLTSFKYAQADSENLKRRCDRQIEESRKYANERLIIELLNVADELELAIKSSHKSDTGETLVQGVEMTLKKLTVLFKREGVSPIECVGKPFDPSKHDAVARIEKEGVEDCTVVEEVRKGYVMKEKVIRPSIVKVVVKPSSNSQEEMSSDE
jgi:molecular chaperone GrpE